jgi:PAS domain S-box-containing protein
MGVTKSLSKENKTASKTIKSDKVWGNAENVKQVLQHLGDHVWLHNFATEETSFSSNTNPFIGYTVDELKNQKGSTIWWDSTLPADRHLLMESDYNYKNGLQDHHCMEYRIKDRKGRLHWVLDRGVVYERDKTGKPLVVVGTHTDITEMKELKKKLEDAEHVRKREVVDAIIRNMEADRGDIANELHNNINQILSAARMMLEFIPMINEEMGAYTEKVKFIIYSAVDEVNRICNLINPNSLDQVSLPELLKDQIQRATKDKKLTIDFTVNGFQKEKRNPRESELTMLRVIQDAVYRMSQYSNAKHADINLRNEHGFMLLDIFFDDPKFDLARTTRNLRVVNLANRCEHFGGSYHLEKEKNKGIHLKASVKSGKNEK